MAAYITNRQPGEGMLNGTIGGNSELMGPQMAISHKVEFENTMNSINSLSVEINNLSKRLSYFKKEQPISENTKEPELRPPTPYSSQSLNQWIDVQREILLQISKVVELCNSLEV